MWKMSCYTIPVGALHPDSSSTAVNPLRAGSSPLAAFKLSKRSGTIQFVELESVKMYEQLASGAWEGRLRGKKKNEKE